MPQPELDAPPSASAGPAHVLTSQQTARMLGLTPATLALWRFRGKGPRFCRINGRVVRYLAVDVIAWLQQHALDPAEARAAREAREAEEAAHA